MKAAVITERGAAPVVQEFAEPIAQAGDILIEIDTAGLGGWDVLGAYRLGVQFPCVIRGEGVGRAPDGRRVYFGERSTMPFGAWAERTVVPAEEVWDVPDGVDDKTAITMGIAATGALVPLEQANIRPGERVLILGATGTLGQVALQLARYLGAGKVVAAARSAPALQRLKERGIADAVVVLGSDDDVSALKASADGGFDVVLDLVCGQPMINALKSTRFGKRIFTIGTGAGRQVNLDIADLLFRTLSCIGTGQRPPADRRAMWERLGAFFSPSHRRKVKIHCPIAARAVQFAILTACRSGEVRGARWTWSEIDTAGKLWTIPAERMKAGREHLRLNTETTSRTDSMAAVRARRSMPWRHLSASRAVFCTDRRLTSWDQFLS